MYDKPPSLHVMRLHPHQAHRTDALLKDYSCNKLRKMEFAGNSRENCTHHAQLMITPGTLTASQTPLDFWFGQLCNARKMKWINRSSRQKAKAVINLSSFIYCPFLLHWHFMCSSLQQ